MESSNSNITKGKMKEVVRSLCRVSRMYEKRDLARLALREQFERAKRISLKTEKNKWAIMREFENLNRRMEEVILKESEVLKIGKRQDSNIESIKNRLADIDNRDSSQMNVIKDEVEGITKELKNAESRGSKGLADSKNLIDEIDKKVSEIVVKVDSALEKRRARENRIEARLQKSLRNDLKKKMGELELQHARLRMKGVDPKRLDKLKSKIDSIKSVLA